MNSRFRSSLMAVSMVLTASASAETLPQKNTAFDLDDLPVLTAEKQHAIASKRVASRFTRSHYKQFSLNDTFSLNIFNRYIEMLDHNRYFLTQQDLDSLAQWQTLLDDQLKQGDTSAAFSIFNLAQKQRFLRYQYALSLLDKPFDFTLIEEIQLDRSDARWAKNSDELNELWRKRVKYDALNLKLAGKKPDEIKTTLQKRYQNTLKRLTQTHSEDVFQTYMNAFAREVDPHTSYLSPRNAEQFQSEMNLSLEGIGAVLQVEDDFTVIRSLVAGGPASESKKLTSGDRIVSVGQEKGEMVEVIGWRLDDVVQLIKGPKGSDVRLEISPEGVNTKNYIITLTRDKIRLEDRAAKSEVKNLQGKKIGVLEIPSFYVGLTEDTKKELVKLNKENVHGIVIDLRNNGGGALTEATSLTGLFINSGPVVQVRDSYGRIKVNGDSDNELYFNGPLTVLINRYSASASEIFAAAMQDYGRALVLGEQSFGKGTVQQHRSLNHIYDLFEKPLGHVQYTIQKFYRINGGSTQNLGVVPDIRFPSPIDPAETGESVEDNALPWDSIDPAKYKRQLNLKSLVSQLQVDHSSRIKQDIEFNFIFQDIRKYQKEKDINAISLNEKTRIAEQNNLDSQRLERINLRQKQIKGQTFKSLDAIPKDYEAPDAYLNEAIAITSDLVKKKTKQS